MVIGVIGASFSGLVAGKRLALAGHDVTVIEKNQALGGRLATTELNGQKLDYGLSHLKAETETFRFFLDDLEEQKVLQPWAEEFHLYDGTDFLEADPNAVPELNYAGADGVQFVAKKLGRWVDVKSSRQAGGLTYMGPDTQKKRPWMINLTNISVFECDAVIIATPAVEAYGILQTAQDETAAKKIIRHIDEIRYQRCISLAATFDQPMPEWKGIKGENCAIRWIGNESSKRGEETTGLVIQSSPQFYREYAQAGDAQIQEVLLKEASKFLDPWIFQPQSTFVHRWKYFRVINPMDEFFIELEMNGAPLALVGDYLGGKTAEDAYLSGYNLAEYWMMKYNKVTA